MHHPVLRVLISLLPAVFALLQPAGAQAACSSYFEKAYLNEYYYTASDTNFLEIFIPNNKAIAESEWQTWKVRVNSAKKGITDYPLNSLSNSQVTACAFGSKTYVTWIQNTTINVDLPSEGDDVNVVLLDGAGNEIDYLKFGSASPQLELAATPHQCTYSALHDIDYQILNAANKNVARFPDGKGDWSTSTLTGAGTTNTQCTSNDPSIGKTVSGASIPLNTTGYFEVLVTNPGNSAMSNMKITDALPTGLTLQSATVSTGTYSRTTGWTYSTPTAITYTGSYSLSSLAKDTAVKLTLYFQGATIGSYTNTASLTYDGLTYTASDSAIANIVPVVDHYELSVPASSISCSPSTVTLTACSNNTNPCTSAYAGVSGQSATIATSAGTLASTSVTFNSSGVATTTLSYPTATNGATATVSLTATPVAATNANQCSPLTTGCTTTFSTAGLIFTTAADAAAANIANQVAAVDSATYYLRAVKSGTSTKACEAALTGTRNINFGYECLNPATCVTTNQMSITGAASATTIASNNSGSVSSYLPVSMTFDANGNAPFKLNYLDVGQVKLHANTTVNSAPLNGASNPFVVKPHHFSIDAVSRTSDGVANPAASSATGPVFIAAGDPFTVKVTARNALNNATPSYGKESPAESVKLSSNLVLPSPGNNPAIVAATGFGAFTNGTATGTDFTWGEVGIITLTPSVKDGDYLGAGDVTGTASGNVGRFIPHHFAASAPVLTNRSDYTSCSSTFTYLGEPLKASFALTAQNAANATTQNYTGAFAKLDLATPANLAMAAIDQGSPVTPFGGRLTVASSSGSWSNGVATTNAELSVAKAASPDGPFNSVAIGTLPKDSDNVTILTAALNLDSDNNGSNDRYRLATTKLYQGRLSLTGACGSANTTLSMPLAVQYYDGSNGNFVNNSSDSCTTVNVALNPNPNSSCVWDNPTTPLSGSNACATAAPAGKAFAEPPVNGLFNLWLKGGASGSVGVTASMQTGASYGYLQYPWSGATASDTTRNATFGIFCRDNVIYLRDTY